MKTPGLGTDLGGCWRCGNTGHVLLPTEGYCWCDHGARARSSMLLLRLRVTCLVALAILAVVVLNVFHTPDNQSEALPSMWQGSHLSGR